MARTVSYIAVSEMKRNRIAYFTLWCIVILAGLGSRMHPSVLPPFVATYAGDTLWAVMAFVGIALLVPAWQTLRIAAATLLLSCAVEVSQLYHAPWIDSLRNTRIGGLVLGFGFLWSDVACYAVGTAIGVLLDIWLSRTVDDVVKEF